MNARKEARELAGRLSKRMREMTDKLHAENRTFNASEQVHWDQINDDYNAAIRIAESHERSQPGSEGLPGRDDVDHGKGKHNRAGKRSRRAELETRAVNGWVRRQHGKRISKSHGEAARELGIDLRHNELELSLYRTTNAGGYADFRDMVVDQFPRVEKRAMSVMKLAQGAALVPEGFMRNFEVALLAYGQMRDACDIWRTAEGNPIPWPVTNDTVNTGSLISENTTVSEVDVTVGQILFNAYKFTSNMVKVPVELMEDSAFDLSEELANLLAIRLARILNTKYTVGSGAAEPMGIVTACVNNSATTSALSATALSADDTIALWHSVDPLYRTGGAYMCHDTILKNLRQLKDGMGRYIWSNGLDKGRPDTLNDCPVYINQAMDSTVSSGKNTLLFGQLKKYKIREVATMRLRRLVERFADADQEGYVSFMRADGNLLDAGTHPVKVLTH